MFPMRHHMNRKHTREITERKKALNLNVNFKFYFFRYRDCQNEKKQQLPTFTQRILTFHPSITPIHPTIGQYHLACFGTESLVLGSMDIRWDPKIVLANLIRSSSLRPYLPALVLRWCSTFKVLIKNRKQLATFESHITWALRLQLGILVNELKLGFNHTFNDWVSECSFCKSLLSNEKVHSRKHNTIA